MRNPRWLFGMTLLIAALSGGCATRAVWGIKDVHAATDPHLSLAYAPERYDFLVTYDETQGSTKFVQTKAYWLFSTADNPRKNHRPDFAENTNFSYLVSVPVMTNLTNAMPDTGYSAALSTTFNTFDLYRNGVDLGRFQLPQYSTAAKPATVSRVMLTPPAVIADTVMESTLFALYTSPYWLQALGH